MSKTDPLRFALLNCGWSRVTNAKTRKYEVYQTPSREGFLFLGKAGALRTGKTATDNIPVSERFLNELLWYVVENETLYERHRARMASCSR